MKKNILIVAALLLLMSGCSKVNKENYSMIKTGMSYDEVTTILGKASSCDEKIGISSCVWGDDKSYISVQFVADKASFFSNKNIK